MFVGKETYMKKAKVFKGKQKHLKKSKIFRRKAKANKIFLAKHYPARPS